MKKITLLLLFAGVTVFAQQAQSYTDLKTEDYPLDQNNQQEAQIIRIENNRQPIIDTYSNIDEFNTALNENCSDTTLTSENFEGGPANITSCGIMISDQGDGCFSPGEIESGFNVQASNSSEVVNIPPGAIGNIDSLVGATTFVEYTIISFSPNVYAVAMDLWENSDPTTTVRIYGDGGVLLETLNVITPVNSQNFFGIIADEPISKIELEGANGSGELFGNFLFGANCFLSTNDIALTSLSVYPNPASNEVSINLPTGVELVSTTLHNLLGKVVSKTNSSETVSLKGLPTGVYMLTINTDQGSITKKVIKN